MLLYNKRTQGTCRMCVLHPILEGSVPQTGSRLVKTLIKQETALPLKERIKCPKAFHQNQNYKVVFSHAQCRLCQT